MSAVAEAKVRVHIDLSSQRMSVTSSSGSYVWPVSTARSGYVTPRGTYAPYSLQRMHYSRKYHMSPMPHSIFFHAGWAIHGTNEARALGRPASHGCVRLSKENAAKLFAMVKAEGAVINIDGTPPHGTMIASNGKSKTKAVKLAKAKQRPAPVALGVENCVDFVIGKLRRHSTSLGTMDTAARHSSRDLTHMSQLSTTANVAAGKTFAANCGQGPHAGANIAHQKWCSSRSAICRSRRAAAFPGTRARLRSPRRTPRERPPTRRTGRHSA